MNFNIIKVLFVSIFMFFIIGCSLKTNNDGVKPTKEFTLLSYYSDNMIFQQNEDFQISGISEEGVIIKASLYNEEDELVVKSETMADVNGKFNIILKGQKASYNKYYIVINDGVNTKKIKNISFGEVWLFAGEDKLENFDLEYEEEVDFSNIYFVKYLNGKINWLNYEESSDVNSLVKSTAVALQKELDVPVSFIDATLENGFADCWLSYETAKNHKNINNYLKQISRFSEEDEIKLNTNELGSMYQTYINEFKGFNIKGILWNQGNSDFRLYSDFNSNTFITNYVYLLRQVFIDMMNVFGNNIYIYSLQEGFNLEEYVHDLRNEQSIPTFQLNNVLLITTYDTFEILENKEENEPIEIEEEKYIFSNKKFVERIINYLKETTYSKNHINVSSSFTNFIVNNNDITISFNEYYKLEDVEELYGLEIIDKNGEKIEYEFDIDENNILITLNIEDDNEENMDSYTIYYGYIEEIYKCNLKTTTGMPIVPFKINISR